MTSSKVLAQLVESKVLSALDLHFALAMARISGEQSDEVVLATALASRAVQRGHVCLDMGALFQRPLLDDEEHPVDVQLPALDTWTAALRASALVSSPGSEQRPTPLVLDDGARLYLHRYADYQRRLAQSLLARVSREPTVDDDTLRSGVARLFPPGPDKLSAEHDEQRLAALIATTRGLCVISGGPGTGKTTTVVKILALLQEQALALYGKPARIALLAPTGKAAARLAESINERVTSLDCTDVVRAAVPRRAGTIHRELGFLPRTPTRFRHDALNPLTADVVLVDEASMVDLALMTKLVEAVPQEARLILLGDKDQLASVEAGAILGDIYNIDAPHGYSRELAHRIEELSGSPPPAEGPAPQPGIQDCMVQLTKSYRYDESSGIGALARAINRGDADTALSVLLGEAGMPYGEVALAHLDEQRPLRGPLGATVVEGFGAYLACDEPGDRLEQLARFRVLCAHRRGALGVETLNALIEQRLREAGAIRGDGPHYDGRPILITKNDYQLGLFNGDVGVVHKRPGRAALVYFSTPEGPPRAVHPGRLPPHDTVFAMTVHKSQGSEFGRVALLLPERVSPILTRELVYTAISRARDRVDLYGHERVLREAIGRTIERASGLRSALWAE
jgi:exodeoxyribonuclease V alpha subunit